MTSFACPLSTDFADSVNVAALLNIMFEEVPQLAMLLLMMQRWETSTSQGGIIFCSVLPFSRHFIVLVDIVSQFVPCDLWGHIDIPHLEAFCQTGIFFKTQPGQKHPASQK